MATDTRKETIRIAAPDKLEQSQSLIVEIEPDELDLQVDVSDAALWRTLPTGKTQAPLLSQQVPNCAATCCTALQLTWHRVLLACPCRSLLALLTVCFLSGCTTAPDNVFFCACRSSAVPWPGAIQP